jgi:hypothetical protein
MELICLKKKVPTLNLGITFVSEFQSDSDATNVALLTT